MNNRTRDASPAPDGAPELRSELARKISLFMGSAENRATDIPGLTLYRMRQTKSILDSRPALG